MAIIFNSKENNITKEQMETLYRNNLIECDDFTFTVATIPDWAVEEAKELWQSMDISSWKRKKL
jgi:hypothetical protein